MRNCSVGIIERPEKLLLLAGASVLVAYDVNALAYAFIIISVLGQITAVQRLWATWNYNQRIHLLHNREAGGETP
jgi:hypothetical protein